MRRTTISIALIAAAIAWTAACNGGSGDDQDATATPAATAAGTAVPATATPDEAGANWNPVPPMQAADIGRTECPTDWLAYRDSQDRFSLCYPGDYSAVASDFALNAHSPRTQDNADYEFSVVVAWHETSGYGGGFPSADSCRLYTDIVEGPQSSTFQEVPISGDVAPACFTVGPIQSSLHGTIAVAGDGSPEAGFVQFRVTFIGPQLNELPDTALQIVGSLRVGGP